MSEAWIARAVLLGVILMTVLVRPTLLPRWSWSSLRQGLLFGAPELAIAAGLLAVAVHSGIDVQLTALARLVPFVVREELIFRFLLLACLVKLIGVRRGVVLSSIAFAAIHLAPSGPDIGWVIPDHAWTKVWSSLAGGLLYGVIYVRTRNPFPPLILHWAIDAPFFVAADGNRLWSVIEHPGFAAIWGLEAAYALWLLRVATLDPESSGSPAVSDPEPVPSNVR